MRADGILYDLNEEIPLEKNKKHGGAGGGPAGAAARPPPPSGGFSGDCLRPCRGPGDGPLAGENRDLDFSQNYACADCGISLSELEPRMFSYNTPYGACPECTGLGFRLKADPALVIPDPQVHSGGAIQVSGWNSVRTDSIFRMYFDALAQKYHFSLTEPFASLPQEAKDVILYGTKGRS